MNNMNKSNTSKLGWVVAGALALWVAFSGFQGATEKTGVVDLIFLVNNSKFGKNADAELKKMQDARLSVLKFIDDYRVLTQEQADKLKTMSLNLNPTDAQKQELDKLKADIMATKKKSDDLVTKQNLTADEKALMNDYADRGRKMDDLLQRWNQDFLKEAQEYVKKQQNAAVERARAAVKDVASKQGYTIVLEAQVAPYGANDLTDASLKAMDAKP
jgi:Skp family chaperone for outer membrane proteins